MANFGFKNLILVNPKVDLEKARKFASHGVSVLDNAKIRQFEDLRDFDYLIGTTAIFDVSSTNVLRSTVSPRFMAEAVRKVSGSICLVFGRDTIGLKNEELRKLDLIVSIYASSSYPTLNLGHSAAIILYELTKHHYGDKEEIASKEERLRLVGNAINLAESSGYPNFRIPILERALRQLIAKGRPTSREATLIIGLLRKASKLINENYVFSKT
jgi:TrmH family RNA methyltransferase